MSAARDAKTNKYAAWPHTLNLPPALPPLLRLPRSSTRSCQRPSRRRCWTSRRWSQHPRTPKPTDATPGEAKGKGGGTGGGRGVWGHGGEGMAHLLMMRHELRGACEECLREEYTPPGGARPRGLGNTRPGPTPPFTGRRLCVVHSRMGGSQGAGPGARAHGLLAGGCTLGLG